MKTAMLTLLTVMWGPAAEITTDHIVAAVCQIETGTIWLGPGKIKGKAHRGAAGETGPWQMMPYCLRELGRDPERNESSVLYAEKSFRLWYAKLLKIHGSHEEALAAYHRGARGKNKKEARFYAERVLNLAGRLANE